MRYAAQLLDLNSSGAESECMSTTMIDHTLGTRLPEAVCAAAGLRAHDLVEWRFEGGEIRGRKVAVPRVTARLVSQGGLLVFQADGVKLDLSGIERAVEEERESR